MLQSAEAPSANLNWSPLNVAVDGTLTGFIETRNFYYSESHQYGSSLSLTTSFLTIGAGVSQYTHSGSGTKTIDLSLEIQYSNVSYTNDSELSMIKYHLTMIKKDTYQVCAQGTCHQF